MARTSLVVGVSLIGGVLLGACGQSQEDSSRLNRTLGGVKEGAPLGPAPFDPGILLDGGSYQPPKAAVGAVAAVTGKAIAEPPAAAARADPQEQAKAVATALSNAIKDGEADLALRLFNPEHVKPLLADVGVFFATFEKIDELRRFLRARLTGKTADGLVAGMIGADMVPTCELLDADHATVTPNPAAILLGPAKVGKSLQLVRQNGEWRFQLEGPLSDADALGVKTYHEGLQAALDGIVEWLDQTANVDPAAIQSALSNVAQGKPPGLGGVGTGDDAPPQGQGKAAPGGRGRGG